MMRKRASRLQVSRLSQNRNQDSMTKAEPDDHAQRLRVAYLCVKGWKIGCSACDVEIAVLDAELVSLRATTESRCAR